MRLTIVRLIRLQVLTVVHHLLTKYLGLSDSLQRLKIISVVGARIKMATAATTATVENEVKGERERGHRLTTESQKVRR